MRWSAFWRRPDNSRGDGESGNCRQSTIDEATGIPGDAESEEEPFLLAVMMWRMRRSDAVAVVGVTEELGDGERIWFRVSMVAEEGRFLLSTTGDAISRDPVVAEVRTTGRARERAEAATPTGRGWRVVDGPREVEVPVPGLTEIDVLAGWPLREWARGLAEEFAAGGL